MRLYLPTRHQQYMLGRYRAYKKHILELMRHERATDGVPNARGGQGRFMYELSENPTLYKLSRRLQRAESRSIEIHARSYILMPTNNYCPPDKLHSVRPRPFVERQALEWTAAALKIVGEFDDRYARRLVYPESHKETIAWLHEALIKVYHTLTQKISAGARN